MNQYRYFLSGHDRELVDDDSQCSHQHEKKNPPLFHIHYSVNGRPSTAWTIRCPKSLSPEERKKLQGGKT